MADIEIGMGKSGRRAYGFDDIAIVPSRRTRDPEDVDISWQIDAYRFELPLMGSAMDGVISPATAIQIGRLGGVGVLNLEGLWTRYEDADDVLAEIASQPVEKATQRMQELYQEFLVADVLGRCPDMVGISVAFPEQTVEAVRFARRAKRTTSAAPASARPLVMPASSTPATPW